MRSRIAGAALATFGMVLTLLPAGEGVLGTASHAVVAREGTLTVVVKDSEDLGGTHTVLRAYRKNDDGTWGVLDLPSGERRPDATLNWSYSESDKRHALRLAPGQYRVSVDVGTKEGYGPAYSLPRRYLGGGTSLDTAALHTVVAGGETVLDLVLPAAGTISGRVQVPKGFDPRRLRVEICETWTISKGHMVLGHEECVPKRRANPAVDGTWTLRQVVGRRAYAVRITDPRGVLATVYSGQKLEPMEARGIDVQRGQQVRGISLAMPARGVITGRITAPAVRRKRGVTVEIHRFNDGGWSSEASLKVNSRGRYRHRISGPGRFRISWSAPGSSHRYHVVRNASNDYEPKAISVRHGQTVAVNGRYVGPEMSEYPHLGTRGKLVNVGDPVLVYHQAAREIPLTTSYRWYVTKGKRWVRLAGVRGSQFYPDASLVGRKLRVKMVLRSKKHGTRTLWSPAVKVHP